MGTPTKKKTAAHKPRPQAERREEAMTKILDTAERLFALHGRDGVTIRALGEEAGLEYALIRYYFGDMDAVFRAVFHRKAVIINAIRNNAMDEYLAKHGDSPTVDGAFDVFLRPVFETFWRDPKYWNHFAAIVSYANSTAFMGGSEMMREAFDETVHRFIDLLKRMAPGTPPESVYWLYHVLSGSLAVSLAQTGRINKLSEGLCDSSDMKSVFEATKKIFIAGYEAIRVDGGISPEQIKSSKVAKARRKP